MGNVRKFLFMLRPLALFTLICIAGAEASAQIKVPAFSQFPSKVEKPPIQAIDFT